MTGVYVMLAQNELDMVNSPAEFAAVVGAVVGAVVSPTFVGAVVGAAVLTVHVPVVQSEVVTASLAAAVEYVILALVPTMVKSVQLSVAAATGLGLTYEDVSHELVVPIVVEYVEPERVVLK